MTQFVHLMCCISSAASPELQFSHPQTIYTSNSMIMLSTKYRKVEKCKTKMIIKQNTHLSGKGSEFIVRPKTKFTTVKSFCFGHTNIKYLILYSYVHFGRQWARIDGGRRDTTGELFLRGKVQVKFGFVCLGQFRSPRMMLASLAITRYFNLH